jgi:LCP family protein required for cell wall assembly
MRDGDNATPGYRNGADGDSGNHADGVPVAVLIARMGGVTGGGRRARRREPQDASWQNVVTGPLPGLPRSPILDFDCATTMLPPAGQDVPDRSNQIGDAGADPTPANNRRRPAIIAGRTATALASVFALAVTGGAWHWNTSKDSSLKSVSALDPNSTDIVDPAGQVGDENFLIAGVDSRYGDNTDMGAGTTDDAGGIRSDTVMLVNIPASRKRVVAVSFPRDLAITPMLCDAWDPQSGKYGPVYDEQTHSYGPAQIDTETKLNSTYAFGGPKCLVKEIQKLSGLSINRFIAVDFVGFAKMVDAVGGVRVCSTTPLQDYELGTVLPRAGWQTLDGRSALNYVRARQVTTEVNGDYGRIKRQQLFLSSLLRSLISNDVFFSPTKLNDVVNAFISNSAVDNVRTKDLVNLGRSVQGMSAGRVTFLTVPTGQTDSDGNEPLRSEDNRALFDAIINDDPLPGENNLNETTTPTPLASSVPPADAGEVVNAVTAEPQAITVHVSNSTGQDGLGASAATELQQHGFRVLTPDNYPDSLASTTVLFSSGNEQAAATVASVFPDPRIERVAGMDDVVQVVLGPDFRGVTAPPPMGSSVQVHLTHTATSTPLPQDLSVTNAADVSCK